MYGGGFGSRTVAFQASNEGSIPSPAPEVILIQDRWMSGLSRTPGKRV